LAVYKCPERSKVNFLNTVCSAIIIGIYGNHHLTACPEIATAKLFNLQINNLGLYNVEFLASNP
jgi:hypothetical protein